MNQLKHSVVWQGRRWWGGVNKFLISFPVFAQFVSDVVCFSPQLNQVLVDVIVPVEDDVIRTGKTCTSVLGQDPDLGPESGPDWISGSGSDWICPDQDQSDG